MGFYDIAAFIWRKCSPVYIVHYFNLITHPLLNVTLLHTHCAGHRVLSETSWPKEIAPKYFIEWSLGSMRRVILSKDFCLPCRPHEWTVILPFQGPREKGNEPRTQHSRSSSGQPKFPPKFKGSSLIAYYHSLSSSATLLVVPQERDFKKGLQVFCLPYDSNSSLTLKCAAVGWSWVAGVRD